MMSLLRLIPRVIRRSQRQQVQISACQGLLKPHGLLFHGFSLYSSSKHSISNQHLAISLPPLVPASAATVNENHSAPVTSSTTSSIQRFLTIPVEATTFKDLIAADIFVDKTLVIQQSIFPQGSCLRLCLPPRWGKSMFLSMLEQYLRIEVNSDGSKKYELSTKDSLAKKRECKPLFYAETNGGKKLKISQNTEMEEKQMGEWPVIRLTMPEFGENETLQEMKDKIKSSISKAYQMHSYLVQAWKAQIEKNPDDSFLVEEMNKKIAKFNLIAQNQGRNAYDSFIQSSLDILSRLLKEHFEKKAIILIDQIDRPYCSYFYNEQIQRYLKDIFEYGIQNNHNRSTVVVVGVSNIQPYGSTLSNFSNYTVGSGLWFYNNYFGYSAQEVKVLAAKVLYGVEKVQQSEQKTFEEELKLLKDYCNGYWIGKKELHTPQPINRLLKTMQYQKAHGQKYQLTPVYPQTGSTKLIQRLLLNRLQSCCVIELLKTYRYLGQIRPHFHSSRMDTLQALLHFLLFNGYLNKYKQRDYRGRQIYVYFVPNQEMKLFFYDNMVQFWIRNKMKTDLKNISKNVKRALSSLDDDAELKRTITLILKQQFDLRNVTVQKGQKQAKIHQETVRDCIFAFLMEANHKMKQLGYASYVGSQFVEEPSSKENYMNFVPVDGFTNTSYLHDYQTIPQHQKRHGQTALQNALWRMVSEGYFETIVNRSNPLSHIKKIKMSAIVASGKPKVWVESYTFEMDKAAAMAKDLGDFFGSELASRKKRYYSYQETRDQFSKRFNCEKVRDFLKQYALPAEKKQQ